MMKLPVKLALFASVGALAVAGLTAGSGFAYANRDSGNAPSQVTNLALQASAQLELKGAQLPHQAGRTQNVVQVVADALSMEVADVMALMEEGNTLAQIIEDNGGNIEQIVDTLVDQMRERLQEKVDQRLEGAGERITKFLNGEHPKDGERHQGRAGHVVQVVANALNLEAADVAALMKEGNTLVQIIETNGGSVDQIVDTLVDQMRERLQEKVDSGDITQEQMDQRMAKARERVTKMLNGERPSHRGHRKGDARSSDRQFRGRARGDARAFGLENSPSADRFRGDSAADRVFNADGGRGNERMAARMENLTAGLQNAVDNGGMTQEQMDLRLDRLQERQLSGFGQQRARSEFSRAFTNQ